MARTVNEQEYAERYNAILTVAQRLVETKGYEQMAIQDILDTLHISKGAFYHYFASKQALLLALVEHIGNSVGQVIVPIVDDPDLNALAKLRRFFAVLDEGKVARKDFVLGYIRVWYADENALVRQKLYMARVRCFTPLLEKIIRQGIQEGTLTTSYPDQAGRIVFSLLEDLGYACADLMLSAERGEAILPRLEYLAAACTDALERVLGVPPGSLAQYERSDLVQWLPEAEKSSVEAGEAR